MAKKFSDRRANMSPEAQARAEAKTQAVPDSCTTIHLSLKGQQRFAEMTAAPPEPTEAMKALGALEDFEETPGAQGADLELNALADARAGQARIKAKLQEL